MLRLRSSTFRPSLLTGVTLLILFLVISSWIAVSDVNDLYWHVRMGEDILAHHRLTGDPLWTFGPVGDQKWVTTQALSEVLMYGWWKALGWGGFALLRFISGIIFLVILWKANKTVIPMGFVRAGKDRVLLLITLITLFFISGTIQERPQTVTFILFVPFAVILLRYLITGIWPNPVIVFFVVMVWSWFHGGAVLVGPLFAAAFGIRLIFIHILKIELPTAGYGNEGRWRWLLVLSAAMIAPLFNPIGINLYLQARKIQEASVGYISEWEPVGITSFTFMGFSLLIVLWVYATMVRLRKTESWRIAALEGAWILMLLVFGMSSARMLVLSFLLMIPVATRRLSQIWNPKPSRLAKYVKPKYEKGFYIVVALIFILPIVPLFFNNTGIPNDSPVRIMSGLANQDTPSGRKAIIAWNINGQFEAFGGAHLSTFLDGRTDRYGSKVIDDYSTLIKGADGWEKIWSTYPETTDVVLEKDDGLISLLLLKGWRTACVQDKFVWVTKPGYKGECSDVIPATTGVK